MNANKMEPSLNHHVVMARSADGMTDPYLSFTRDLHEVLAKHVQVVMQGRVDDVQIAVTPKVAEMLAQYADASDYIGHLRRFDSRQRCS
ncbi:hypothetical protein [Acidithiobacillus sp.]